MSATGAGHGEHDVEVGYRQQFGLARLQPFGARQSLALRTVPIAARVVGVANEPAVGAAFDMPAQRRRPARLDRRHDAALGADRDGRRGPAGTPRRGGGRYPPPPAPGRIAPAQAGVGTAFGDATRRLQGIQRAGGGAHLVGGKAQVAGGGAEAAVTEQQLDGAHVGAGFEQMDGEAVAQRVRCDRLADVGFLRIFLAGVLHGGCRIGCPGRSPGNSHCLGRTVRQ